MTKNEKYNFYLYPVRHKEIRLNYNYYINMGVIDLFYMPVITQKIQFVMYLILKYFSIS